jgi:CPA1 family monovalent cation:H+ antiporter
MVSIADPWHLQWVILLLLVAALLAALARRLGVRIRPSWRSVAYCLRSCQRANWTLDPQLAGALRCADLVDAAYDTSLRDLQVTGGPLPAWPSPRSAQR